MVVNGGKGTLGHTNRSGLKTLKIYHGFLLLAIYTLVGLWITPDYGFSIDEEVQRNHGLVAMHYISDVFNVEIACLEGQKDEDYRSYAQRYYGNTFQLTAISLECLFGFDDWRSRYLLRHYLVLLLFCTAALVLYFLISTITQDALISILCLFVFLLHPRIFAHAHYNPKDIVLLSVYGISMYSLYKVFDRGQLKWLILHGVMTGLLINVRIVGIILVPVTLLMIFLNLKDTLRKRSFSALLYIVATCLSTIALWPLLWEDPIGNFAWAFKSMRKFPWLKDLIYWGEAVPSVDAPWTYLFSWIGITTPLGYSLIFIAALLSVGYWILRNPVENRYPLAISGLTVGPVLAVLLLDSILYGGWRHLYFIYPGLIVLTAFFLKKIKIRFTLFYQGMTVLLALQILLTLGWMVMNHPYQYNYFNVLAQNELGKFEQDYWGLSYKSALEKLVDDHLTDTEKKVVVSSYDYSAFGGHGLLDKAYKDRIKFSWKPEKSDYFISNYRHLRNIESYKKKEGPYANLLFEIKVDGVPICGVFKIE